MITLRHFQGTALTHEISGFDSVDEAIRYNTSNDLNAFGTPEVVVQFA